MPQPQPPSGSSAPTPKTDRLRFRRRRRISIRWAYFDGRGAHLAGVVAHRAGASAGALAVGRFAPELLDVAAWPYILLGCATRHSRSGC